MEGFWTNLSAPSSVDWCEPNYLHSFYVAEWWNTLSSIPIALLGLIGLLRVLQNRKLDGRFVVAYTTITIVGLGSAAFHGTMLKLAQAADELPMIFTGLVFLYVLRFRREKSPLAERRWQLGLSVYAAIFTAAYFTMEKYFTFFILTYAAIVAYVAIRTLQVSFGVGAGRLRRRLALGAFATYVGGVVFLWLPEHVLLDCAHPIQALQLHAIFHLTSAIGSYTWVLWACHDRLSVVGSGLGDQGTRASNRIFDSTAPRSNAYRIRTRPGP